MRYILNTVAATATAAALLLTGTAAAGAAQAQPTQATQPAQAKSLYSPSALVLTIGKGEDAATATVDRAATLNCAPRPDGTHPMPAAACMELRIVDGEFAALADTSSTKTCTRQWAPVVVTAQGVWQGKRVAWSATFGNECEMEGRLAQGAVFAF